MRICEHHKVTSYTIKNMSSIYVNRKISTIAKAGIQNKQYTSWFNSYPWFLYAVKCMIIYIYGYKEIHVHISDDKIRRAL